MSLSCNVRDIFVIDRFLLDMNPPCDDHLLYVENGMSAHLSPKKSSRATSERRPMPSTAFFTRTFKSALPSVVLPQLICLHLSGGL